MKKNIKYLAFFGILIGLIIWSLFIFYYGPENFVNLIGVQNGYLLTFISAVIGGSSIFTTGFFFSTVATLGAGGLNPFLLGLIGGIGVGSGDVIFYYLGKHGRSSLPRFLEKKIKPIDKWVHNRHEWTIPILLFIYCAFSPFPNDIVTALLAAIKIPFHKIIIPLILGNITLIIMISYGFSLFN